MRHVFATLFSMAFVALLFLPACQLKNSELVTSPGGTSTGNALVRLFFAPFLAPASHLSICVTRVEVHGPGGSASRNFTGGKLMNVSSALGGYGGVSSLMSGQVQSVRVVSGTGCGGNFSARLTIGTQNLTETAPRVFSFTGNDTLPDGWAEVTLDLSPIVQKWLSSGFDPAVEGSFTGGVATPVTNAWSPTDNFGTFSFSTDFLTFTAFDFQAVTRAKVAHTSGLYYWEVTMTVTSSSQGEIGVVMNDRAIDPFPGDTACSLSSSSSLHCPTQSGFVGPTWQNGSVLGFAVDLDGKVIFAHINGNWIFGDPQSGTGMSMCPWSGCNPTDPYTPFAMPGSLNGDHNAATANFGMEPFKYPVPTAFQAGW